MRRKVLVVALAMTVALVTMWLLVPAEPSAFNKIGPCCSWEDYRWSALVHASEFLPGILIGSALGSRRAMIDVLAGALAAALARAIGSMLFTDPIPNVFSGLDHVVGAGLCGALGALVGVAAKHLILMLVRSAKKHGNAAS